MTCQVSAAQMDEQAHRLCLEGISLLTSWSMAMLTAHAWRALRHDHAHTAAAAVTTSPTPPQLDNHRCIRQPSSAQWLDMFCTWGMPQTGRWTVPLVWLVLLAATHSPYCKCTMLHERPGITWLAPDELNSHLAIVFSIMLLRMRTGQISRPSFAIRSPSAVD